jgi:hypothetical protein
MPETPAETAKFTYRPSLKCIGNDHNSNGTIDPILYGTVIERIQRDGT